MSSSTSPIDFASLMAPVCLALLGEPQEKHRGGMQWRYGTHGSLRVEIDKGVFEDHETGQKGGTLKIIECRGGMDKSRAMAWMRDQRIIADQPKPASRRIVATYDYTNANGDLLFQVVRYEPKDFRQRRADGVWKMAGVQLVPYRLPAVIGAIKQKHTIFIAEGEKGVQSLESIGLVATCSPGGAGKWRSQYNSIFAGADVVILPDNDPQSTMPDGTLRWHPDGRPALAGQDHANDVARNLSGIAGRVRVVMLPDLPLKGDVADWIASGGTAEAIAELIARAPDWTKAQPEPPAGDVPTMQAYHALRDALDKNGNGAVLPTHANMVLILKRDPLLASLVQFNSFTGLHMLRKPLPVLDKSIRPSAGPYPRPWDGDDITRLLAYVQKSWTHNFRKATVEECLLLEGRDNEVHPVRNYLAGLKWDGKKRLDIWLTMTFGCPQDSYHTAVASKVLIAAVRRVWQPGCKYDELIVLEGDQGIGKSPAIKILFGADWFTDQISHLSSKDAAIDLRGKWCVELAEIEHIIRAEVETVKAFLSRAIDHYRPPYGRAAIDVPRQSVLIGTTNATEYLRDATGNRRIWPVKCLSKLPQGADLDWLRDNRDQLWAEATQRETNAETIWLDNAAIREVAIVEQADRMSEDPWKWKIGRYCEGKLACYEKAKEVGLTKSTIDSHMAAYPAELRGDFVTVAELLEYSLVLPTGQQTKAAEMRGADILKTMSWKKEQKWVEATQRNLKVWAPPTEEGG